MKKKFLMFTTLATIVFMSCSKDQMERREIGQPEFAGAMSQADQQRGGSFANTIDKDLLARFEFNANLKDVTNQVTPVIRFGRPRYTNDRKGAKNSAIRFEGSCGLDLMSVPLDTNMTIAFWMQADTVPSLVSIPVVEGSHAASFIHRENNQFQVNYWDPSYSGQIMHRGFFGGWHHMAVTRNNTGFHLYVDGFLAASHTFGIGGPSGKRVSDYIIGYGMNAGYRFWKGDIDDLRIYKRMLSSLEVNALANL